MNTELAPTYPTPSETQGRRKRPRVAEENRKRVAKACNACRRLKEKCVGGRPCERCTRVKRECQFDSDPKPATPANNSSVFEDFFDVERIRLMEEIIHNFTGSTATLEISYLRQIIGSFGAQLSELGTIRSDKQVHNNEETLEVQDDFALNAPSPNIAAYSEELSHCSFSNHVQRTVDKGLRDASSGPIKKKLEYNSFYKKSSRVTQLHSKPSSQVEESAVSFPPADVAYFLLDIFFDYAQTNYSYLDEKSLRQRLHNFYMTLSPLKSGDEAWVCTALMVFAIGTQFAHLSSRGGMSCDVSEKDARQDGTSYPDDNVALEFYHSAIKLIPEVIATASIESVQAFLLLGIYTLPVDAAGLSYTYFGISIKMAVQNGMHRKYHKNLDKRTIELRKRIWWTAYTLDKRVSVLHGRPTSIARYEVDAELPTDFPDIGNESRINTLPNFLAMIQLTSLLENARDKISFLRKASKMGTSVSPSLILQLKQELEEYWNTLPEKTFCRDLTARNPLFRFNIHLAMMYHLIHVFIGRSFIFDTQKKHNSLAKVTDVPPNWPAARNILVSRCVDSSLAIVDLLETLHNETGLARASYTEFTSCHAALLVILAQRTCEASTRLRYASGRGVEFMKQMSVGIYSASSEKLTIEALERAVDRLDNSSEYQIQESAKTSKSAYEKFRNWAVLWKTEEEIRRGSRSQCKAGEPLTNFGNNDEVLSSDKSTTQRVETYVSPSCFPFGFGELASIPGLDEWNQYNLEQTSFLCQQGWLNPEL